MNQTHVRDLAARFRASFVINVSLSETEGAVRPSREGAGKTGCALHPRSRVQELATRTHTSIQVQRKQSDLPCAMVLRLISWSPWRPAFCHHRPRDARATSLT